MPHPHGDTCRCPAPTIHDGLLAYTVDCDHYDSLRAALAKVVKLRVLTTDPQPPDNLVRLPSDPQACSGEMVCPCLSCQAERSQRVRRGVRPSQPLPFKRKAA